MKKLVSLLLALVLVFAMSSVAMADGDLFQIGDNTYATWNEAYAAANDGDTITLLNDVTLPYKEANNVKPPYGIEKNITIDLAGYTFQPASYSSNYFMIFAEVTIMDSSDAQTGELIGGSKGISVREGGKLVLESGAVVARDTEAAGVLAMGGDVEVNGGSIEGGIGIEMYVHGNDVPVVTINDGKVDGSDWGIIVRGNVPDPTLVPELNITGGEITSDRVAISGQGQEDGTEINISGGTITGGVVGIYHPQQGELNISGGKISGETGVVFRAGELNVSGGTISGTGAKEEYTSPAGTCASNGDGLIVDNMGNAYGDVTVNITAGKITSENGSAVGSYAAEGKEAETGFITGGSFVSAEDAPMDSALISGSEDVEEDYKGGIHVGEDAIANMPTPPTTKRYEVGVVEAENGDVTVKGSASYDSGVVITAAPHYGYEVGTVTVTKADGTKVDVTNRADGTYSFSMPRGEVTIKVTFVPQGEAVKMVLTIGSKAVDVNGKAVASDVAPVIKASRTFLPVRLIAENLGAKVEWNNDAQTVTITKGDTVIVLTVGSTTVLVNGQPAELEAPVFIENSRTYLPVRFIAEKLGADVEWNGATNEVTIIGRK